MSSNSSRVTESFKQTLFDLKKQELATEGVSPELMAQIVRDHILPMFESKQCKGTAVHEELKLSARLEHLLFESRTQLA